MRQCPFCHRLWGSQAHGIARCQGFSSESERGGISSEAAVWWRRRRSFEFGGASGTVEMSELRRMVIDEVESVLKEFVVTYDRETRFVGGLGREGRPDYFPVEWAG